MASKSVVRSAPRVTDYWREAAREAQAAVSALEMRGDLRGDSWPVSPSGRHKNLEIPATVQTVLDTMFPDAKPKKQPPRAGAGRSSTTCCFAGSPSPGAAAVILARSGFSTVSVFLSIRPALASMGTPPPGALGALAA